MKTYLNWKCRLFSILAVFFYGYGASVAPLIGFSSTIDELNFSLTSILTFPLLGGFVAIFPQLGKVFAEVSSHEN